MAKKQGRVCERILLTWFTLAGFILLFAPQSMTNKFRFTFARVFRRSLNIGRNSLLSAHTDRPLTDVISLSRYNTLRNHLANTIQWLRQERQKVEKLSGLQDRPVWKGVNLVLADVITTFGGPHGTLIINRGKDDGLSEGQFVLSDHSVIGTISAVDSRTAQVTVVTDPTSKMVVKIAELDVGVVMQGASADRARVRLLSKRHEVKIGDIVYARKRPGFLEVPVIVGTIDQCKTNDENPLFWDITVKPACDITTVNDVVVIVVNPQD